MQPQRAMSYRKPVPIYVPSPLPSPPPSPRIPPLASLEGTPPLPENWRELVQQATMIPLEESTSQSENEDVEAHRDFASDNSSVLAFNRAFKQSNLNNIGNDVIRPTPARTTSPSSYSQEKQQKKRLCQHYRPPTPPLPSVQRRGSPSDADSEDNTNAEVYVSQRSDISRHYLSLYPNSSWRAGAPSFNATPSIQTERTLVTLNTERSKGWTHGSTTPSDGAMYSSPTLAAKEYNVDDMHRVVCDSPTATCWEGLSLWAKLLVCK